MVLIVNFILTLIQIYSYAVIIYILMSWFPNARETAIGRFLGKIVEPYLEPFRRFVPPIGMIDLSPLVALLVLQFASYGVSQLFIWLT